MTQDPATQFIYLKDYQVPSFLISSIDLVIELHDSQTLVTARSQVKKNKAHKTLGPGELDLFLNGEDLLLSKVFINQEEISSSGYVVSKEGLLIKNVPLEFELTIQNEINPLANKTLQGLYKSGDIFCTQCEAEGFRKITYFLDRPDVMAIYSTKIIADKKFSQLLSNGNLIESGDLPGGKHFAKWHDPFPKPSYLYALVAGDLGQIGDQYITFSGKKVELRIYCDKGNEKKCLFAMESVKNAMKWDEDTFGLEYDLDIYMIVAVSAFNFGAMENKGLNIFNSVFVLADEQSATDENFHGVEGVIGHEYFHNWTGNRITCRDWFQLTLKEGLTVYRDQEFSACMNSPIVQRISDVERLRQAQFSEDGGPNAHPIRPPYYMTIDNFYTATIYEKGAEVIRMIETFVGKSGFRKGMDKYFELFDGKAVTTDDFLYAMSTANNFDTSQFKNWYQSASTPEVSVNTQYDDEKKEWHMAVTQTRRSTRYETLDEIKNTPLYFPLALGLLDKKGKEHPLHFLRSDKNSKQLDCSKGFLHIRYNEEVFTFQSELADGVFSLNRNFRAPIKIKFPYSVEQLGHLMACDPDLFNRYEAHVILSSRLIKGLISDYQNKHELKLHPVYSASWIKLLSDKSLDPALKAKCLTLPSLDLLAQEQNPIDFEAIYFVHQFVKRTLAQEGDKVIRELYEESQKALLAGPGGKEATGWRALKNTLLDFLSLLPSHYELVWKQYTASGTMTERFFALSRLCQIGGEKKDLAVKDFCQKGKNDPLIIQKWLGAEAVVLGPQTLAKVKELEHLPLYDKTIPNFVRALIGRFASVGANLFSAKDNYAGVSYLADKVIEIDKYNPQLAARLLNPFNDYLRLKPDAKVILKKELTRIKNDDKISQNVLEICSKILEC